MTVPTSADVFAVNAIRAGSEAGYQFVFRPSGYEHSVRAIAAEITRRRGCSRAIYVAGLALGIEQAVALRDLLNAAIAAWEASGKP